MINLTNDFFNDSLPCSSQTESIPKGSWPNVDYELIRQIAQPEAFVILGNRNASLPPASDEILERLFPGDPILCTASEDKILRSDFLRNLRGSLSSLIYVVPSRMRKLSDNAVATPLQAPREETIAPREYLVITIDACLEKVSTPGKPIVSCFSQAAGLPDLDHIHLLSSVILHLAAHAPLAMTVVDIGRMQAWFACLGEEESSLREFMNLAVRLGCETEGWDKCMPVWIPDVMFPGDRPKNRPVVLYFNSDNLNPSPRYRCC